MSRRPTESERSDKTDGGELKLICFFDESGTPRNYILNINKTLLDLTSLLSPPSQYTSTLISLSIPISSNLSPCPFHTFFFFFKKNIPHRQLSLIFLSSQEGRGGGFCSIFSFSLFPFYSLPPSLLVSAFISLTSPFIVALSCFPPSSVFISFSTSLFSSHGFSFSTLSFPSLPGSSLSLPCFPPL